jgi:hypothetical protein
MSRGQWDHKHGLAKRGEDYSTDDSAIHGAESLAKKQIQARIFELFGKSTDDADKRRLGIPTHFAEVQQLIKGLGKSFNSGVVTSIEAQVKQDVVKALQFATIDVPPLGIVLPGSLEIWIFYKKGSQIISYGYGFSEGDLNAQEAEWKLNGTALGDFHKRYSVYKAWPYYQNTASPTVTNPRAKFGVVSNFFSDGLQWEGNWDSEKAD